MKKVIILAVAILALGCASWIKADPISLQPTGSAVDFTGGAAPLGASEGCVFCNGGPSPEYHSSPANSEGAGTFALTGISADKAVVSSGSSTGTGTISPDCEPPHPDPTPEPVSMVLFGTGLFALGAAKLRRRA